MNKLKEARKKLGMSQRDVAEEIGIGVSYYAEIERGEKQASIPVKRAIGYILKIKVTE